MDPPPETHNIEGFSNTFDDSLSEYRMSKRFGIRPGRASVEGRATRAILPQSIIRESGGQLAYEIGRAWAGQCALIQIDQGEPTRHSVLSTPQQLVDVPLEVGMGFTVLD